MHDTREKQTNLLLKAKDAAVGPLFIILFYSLFFYFILFFLPWESRGSVPDPPPLLWPVGLDPHPHPGGGFYVSGTVLDPRLTPGDALRVVGCQPPRSLESSQGASPAALLAQVKAAEAVMGKVGGKPDSAKAALEMMEKMGIKLDDKKAAEEMLEKMGIKPDGTKLDS